MAAIAAPQAGQNRAACGTAPRQPGQGRCIGRPQWGQNDASNAARAPHDAQAICLDWRATR